MLRVHLQLTLGHTVQKSTIAIMSRFELCGFKAFSRFDGIWYGNNVKNRVLQEQDFVAWYAEGNRIADAWIRPGQTAACDPNWHYGERDDHPLGMKWAFLSVDAQGNTYFDEAEVTRESAQFFTRD